MVYLIVYMVPELGGENKQRRCLWAMDNWEDAVAHLRKHGIKEEDIFVLDQPNIDPISCINYGGFWDGYCDPLW